jgi:hypothetical protein
MSTNPDEAVGMADEPEQSQSAGTAPGQDTTGAADESTATDAPNPETGVGLGAGEPNTFEPEEDPEA